MFPVTCSVMWMESNDQKSFLNWSSSLVLSVWMGQSVCQSHALIQDVEAITLQSETVLQIASPNVSVPHPRGSKSEWSDIGKDNLCYLPAGTWFLLTNFAYTQYDFFHIIWLQSGTMLYKVRV